MPKRSNEDLQSESESAAKRFANQNENEIHLIVEQKLQAARSALARLDYKNTHQICTELIDSSCCDPSAPLTLRSLNSEKQGYLASSLEDAKRALKLKESKNAHLRCSFAYLAHALHHLECAQKESEDAQEESYSVSGVEIQELSRQIGGLKSLEDGKPFKTRVSEDLFFQMASVFDSPSLVIFSATSKQMRSSIHASTELFRAFQMDGKGEGLATGIKYFSQRCGNSIKSIDVEVKNQLSSTDQELLESAISLSAPTLRAISISHQGDLCKLIIQVASLSHSLKILSSTNTIHGFFPLNGKLKVPPSWNARLSKLVWYGGGGESLVCDDTLLRSLQSAKEIAVYSDEIRPSWVLGLLSSASPTLTSVSFPRVRDGDVDELPSKLDLLNLSNLRLHRAPRSRSTGESLFKCLHAPNLRSLSIRDLTPKDLGSLSQVLHLISFTAFGLLNTDGTLASEAGEEEAISFIKAIKDWKELRILDLRLEGSDFSSFFTHLVDLLTPLSQKSVESGYGDCILLRKLTRLVLGETRSPATATPISARKLAIFVATRSASWKGLSSERISSIAAGDLSQADQHSQGTPFAPIGTSSRITDLRINVPLESDDETFSWLENKVPKLYIKHRIASKHPTELENNPVET